LHCISLQRYSDFLRLTHEPLFQDAIRHAGLNPYLFEMANIRNQCSWIHAGDRDGATAKAQALMRMAVARALRLEPLKTSLVSINKAALVIGLCAAVRTDSGRRSDRESQ